jgi:hypothetical protein
MSLSTVSHQKSNLKTGLFKKQPSPLTHRRAPLPPGTTFTDFIKASRITRSPRGGFLADAKTLINCGKFPTIDSWTDLLRFVRGRNACDDAIALARSLWSEYQKLTVMHEANQGDVPSPDPMAYGHAGERDHPWPHTQ